MEQSEKPKSKTKKRAATAEGEHALVNQPSPFEYKEISLNVDCSQFGFKDMVLSVTTKINSNEEGVIKNAILSTIFDVLKVGQSLSDK